MFTLLWIYIVPADKSDTHTRVCTDSVILEFLSFTILAVPSACLPSWIHRFVAPMPSHLLFIFWLCEDHSPVVFWERVHGKCTFGNMYDWRCIILSSHLINNLTWGRILGSAQFFFRILKTFSFCPFTPFILPLRNVIPFWFPILELTCFSSLETCRVHTLFTILWNTTMMSLKVNHFSFFQVYLVGLFNLELKPSSSGTFYLIFFWLISSLPAFFFWSSYLWVFLDLYAYFLIFFPLLFTTFFGFTLWEISSTSFSRCSLNFSFLLSYFKIFSNFFISASSFLKNDVMFLFHGCNVFSYHSANLISPFFGLFFVLLTHYFLWVSFFCLLFWFLSFIVDIFLKCLRILCFLLSFL